jgi:hypothetical protein
MRSLAAFAIVAFVVAAPVARAQSKPAASFDACSLLTKQEAAAALGEPVKDGESGSARGSVMPNTTASYCEYMSPTTVHKVHLNVWRANASGAAQLKQMGQMVCASKTKDGLAGLGETACWYSEKHGELQVFKGANFISVEMNRKGDTTEAIKSVAKAAVAGLP